MILDIGNVEKAYRHDDDTVRVLCIDTCYQGAVHVLLSIGRDRVVVEDVRASGEGKAPEVAEVLVSITLVDATRRLYDMVGKA